MAFLTIQLPQGLSPAQRREAIESGPPAVAGPGNLAGAVADAGFEQVTTIDVTDQYRATQQAWIEQYGSHLDHLGHLLGADVVRDRQRERRRALRAIDAGLLRRILVAATRR